MVIKQIIQQVLLSTNDPNIKVLKLKYALNTWYLFDHLRSGMINLQVSIVHDHHSPCDAAVGNAEVVPILDHGFQYQNLSRWN